MAGDEENHRVFASDSTRAFFGDLTDRVGVWAGRPILILSPEPDPKNSAAFEKHKELFREYIKYIDNGEAIDEGNFNKFAKNLYDIANEDQEYQITRYSNQGAAPRTATIYTIPLHWTKEDLAASLSGLPKEVFLDSLPGSDLEWHAFSMMHESIHTGEPYMGSKNGTAARLPVEVRGDQGAIALYNREVENGLLQTKEVPQARMAIRALGAFISSADSHVTGAAVQSPNETEPQGGTGEYFVHHLDQTKNAIIAEAGRVLLQPLDRMIAIGETVNTLQENISDSDKEILEAARRDNSLLGDEHAFSKKIESLSNSAKEALEESLNAQTISRGELEIYKSDSHGTISLKDPQLLYVMARKLYDRGDFNGADKAIQKQYVYEFLDASDKYASGYFGTKNGPTTVLEPPVAPGSEIQPQAIATPTLTTP
ncbi:MAG: hypothetical protein DHS20C02_08420 [Micavibrio sp.]|nr:MAG: hypothetical protein DHS20C02_08420 [Micavibrio sp.]